MNPDIDLTSNEGADDASKSKGAFLEALGLDEATLLGETGAPPADRRENDPDEDLVLSSLPDDLGFSAPGTAPKRGFHVTGSIKVQRPAVASITFPNGELAGEESSEAPAAQNESAGIPAPEGKDPEETLHLHCPQCSGALVLKRRHLGVEGACVWCHVPLVAAEAPEEGRVRVFPVLAAGTTPLLPAPARNDQSPDRAELSLESESATGPSAAAPETKTETAATSAEAEAPLSTGFASAFSDLSSSPEESAPAFDKSVPSAAAPAEEPELSEIPMPAFPGFARTETQPSPFPEPAPIDEPGGFTGEFVLPATSVPSAPATNLSVPTIEDLSIPSTPDLDDLYSVGGFLGTEAAPAPAPPAEPAAPSPSPGFASSFAEPAPASGFGGPTPWGPPALAPAPPFSPQTKPSGEPVPASVGFAAMDSPDDAPPAAITDGFGLTPVQEEAKASPPSWEAAFGAPAKSASPSGFSKPEDPVVRTNEDVPFLRETADESRDTDLAVPTETASRWMPSPQEDDLPGSFASPANGFSTGSSELFGESDDSPTLFGDPGFSPPMPWDDKSPDDAPASLDPVGDQATGTAPAESAGLGESLFGSPTAASNLFAPSPDTTAPELPAPVEPAAPSPLPDAEPVSSQPAATPQVTPIVTHAPSVMKPKRKVRKGFLILMVVIVGFAAGAALASFVLPIEEYVNAARGFMEEKFNLPASGTRISSLPSDLESLPSAVPTPGTSSAPAAQP